MEHSNGLAGDVKPDWAMVLPPLAFAAVMLWLRAALPPPLLDEPGEWLARDQVAMAAVASLAPATAAEARLAAQFVACDAYGMDCLRLAQAARHEPEVARRCAAQAMAMMRESRGAMRVLLRVQAARFKVAASEDAARQADWVEHAAVNLMAEALAAAPARVAARQPAPARDVRELGQLSDEEIRSLIASAETEAGLDGSTGAWVGAALPPAPRSRSFG